MSKKIISSKETYFKRPNNPMTLEDWNNFKLANPRPEYLGETCWSLHDSMILRGKPADDSAIVKTLLKEVGVELEQHVDYLKITSDLTGKDVLVVEIECDELLEQLAAAGAKVLYITSNVNYGVKVPEKYFEMYDDGAYDTNDYPATDKRNMFTNKNVIIKYINFSDYKKKGLYYIFLQNALKEHNMKINKVLMNPPYDGSLHLEVLEATLKAAKETNTECEVASVQPARWLEDPLAEYKQGSDYKKYKQTLIDNISKLQLVDATTACKAFNIMNSTDLAIYTFNTTRTEIKITVQDNLINKLYSKISTMTTLHDKLDQNVVDGFRCEVKKLTSGTGGHNLGDYDSSKVADVNIVWGPYTDGYTKDGNFFTAGRQKNQFTKDYFANSIKFNSLDLANNFYLSCNTNFYRRLIHLFKWDVNVPLRFLPYMEDYSKVWTDEDYCKFFDLTEEESEFMCRKVDDYRVKDFINYINLDEE